MGVGIRKTGKVYQVYCACGVFDVVTPVAGMVSGISGAAEMAYLLGWVFVSGGWCCPGCVSQSKDLG